MWVTPRNEEPDEEQQLRELTHTQLDLTWCLADGLHAAQERHGRLVGLLETLWLQIANLKAQVAVEDFDCSEISQKAGP